MASAFPLSAASPVDALLPLGLAGLGGSSLTPVQLAALHSGLSLTASLEDGTAGHGPAGSLEQLSGSTWPLLLPGPLQQPLVMATLPGLERRSAGAGAGAAAEQDGWSETSDPEAVVQSVLLSVVRLSSSTCWLPVQVDSAAPLRAWTGGSQTYGSVKPCKSLCCVHTCQASGGLYLVLGWRKGMRSIRGCRCVRVCRCIRGWSCVQSNACRQHCHDSADRCASSLQVAAGPRADLLCLQARQSLQAVPQAEAPGEGSVGAPHPLPALAQAASGDSAPQLETAPEPLHQSQPQLPAGQEASPPPQQLAAATDVGAAAGGASSSWHSNAGNPEAELPAAAEPGEAGSGVVPHSSAAGATADSEPAAGRLQLTVLAVQPLKGLCGRCSWLMWCFAGSSILRLCVCHSGAACLASIRISASKSTMGYVHLSVKTMATCLPVEPSSS